MRCGGYSDIGGYWEDDGRQCGTPRGCVAYCVSKGAVDSLTRTLACEWILHNVLVNALTPTVVETELTRAIVQDPRGAEHLGAITPLGRWAQPEDIVGPRLFLASGASDYHRADSLPRRSADDLGVAPGLFGRNSDAEGMDDIDARREMGRAPPDLDVATEDRTR